MSDERGAVTGRQEGGGGIQLPYVENTVITSTDTTVSVFWEGSAEIAVSFWEVRIFPTAAAVSSIGAWEEASSTRVSPHIFTGLTPNTNYTVQIRGTNDAGTGSVWSATVNTGLTIRPGAPTLSTSTNNTDIGMTWVPSAEGSPPTSWEVKLDDGAWVTPAGGAAARSHTFGSLSANSNHTVYLRGENEGGKTPEVSAAVTTTGASAVPNTPSATVTAGDNTIRITITPASGPRVSKWQVNIGRTTHPAIAGSWIDIPGGWSATTHNVTSINDANPVQPGQTYTVQVRGVNDFGAGGATASQTVSTTITTGLPRGPIFVARAVDPTTVRALWIPDPEGGSVRSWRLTISKKTFFSELAQVPNYDFAQQNAAVGAGLRHVIGHDPITTIKAFQDGDWGGLGSYIANDSVLIWQTLVSRFRDLAWLTNPYVLIINFGPQLLGTLAGRSESQDVTLPGGVYYHEFTGLSRDSDWVITLEAKNASGSVIVGGNVSTPDEAIRAYPGTPTVTVTDITATTAIVRWEPATTFGTASRWYVRASPWNIVTNISHEAPAGNRVAEFLVSGTGARSAPLSGLTPGIGYRAFVVPANGWSNNRQGRGGVAFANFETQRITPDAPSVTLSATSNTITANWTPNGAAATSWQIRLGTSGAWTNVTGGAAARTHTFTGLTPATQYTVQVRGVNAGGNGPAGAAIISTTTATPNAPTVTATATDVTVTANWTAASTGPAATSWEARIGSGAWRNTGLSRTITFSGLTAGTAHTVQVRGINAGGAGAIGSVTISTTTVTAPHAPTLAATPGSTTITANWTPASTGDAANSWQARIGTGDWVDVAGGAGARQHIFTGLTAATAYTIQVRGVNSGGNGAAASATTTTVGAATSAPAVPTNVSVSNIATTSVTINATLTATATAPLTHLVIRVAGDISGSDEYPRTSSGATSQHVGGLTSNTFYFFYVSAKNAFGTSEEVRVSARTLAEAGPSAPLSVQNLSADNIIETGFRLKWTIRTPPGRPVVDTAITITGSGAPTGQIVVATATGGDYTYTFSGLRKATVYNLSVVARNGAGSSPPATLSVLTSGTPDTRPSGFPRPQPPTSISARNVSRTLTFRGTSVIVTLRFSTYLFVRPDGSTDRPRSNLVQNLIVNIIAANSDRTWAQSERSQSYASAAPSEVTPRNTAHPQVVEVRFDNLRHSTVYNITGLLVNDAGYGREGTTSILTLGDPTVPLVLAPTVSGTGAQNSVTVNWVPNPGGETATGWQVRLDSGAWVTPIGGRFARTHTFSGLAPSTSFLAQVRGLNSSGHGAIGSTTIETRTVAQDLPGAPTLSAVGIDTIISFWWTPADDRADSWERQIDSGAWIPIPGGPTTRAGIIGGFVQGSKHTLRLRGRNAFGAGAPSEVEVTLGTRSTTLPRIDSPPTIVAQNGEVDLQFVLSDAGSGTNLVWHFRREADGSVDTDPQEWRPFVPDVLGFGLGHEDGTVTNGVEYRYEVRATTSAGSTASGWSNRATPRDGDTVPEQLANLLSQAGGSGRVELSHPPARASSEAPVTGYEYRASSDGGATWGAWTAYTGITPDFERNVEYAVLGLSDDVEHTFQVRGVNRIGAAPPSDQTPPVTTTAVTSGGIDKAPELPVLRDPSPVPQPDAPTGEAIAGGIRWLGFVHGKLTGLTLFKWQYAQVNDAGEIGAAVSIPVSRGATTAIIDGNVTAGDSYRIVMRLQTDKGTGPWSEPSALVRFGTPATPEAPEKPVVTPIGKGLKVEWTANGDGGSPFTEWQYSIDGGTSWTAFAGRGGDTRTGIITGLTAGTDYRVMVRALNAVGNGAASPASD